MDVRRHSHSLIIAVGILLLLAASAPPALSAQSVYGRLRGTAFDSLGGVVGARVSLVGTTLSAITDPAGRFELDHVPAGVYLVRAEGAGRTPGEVEGVRVLSGTTASVAIRLGRRAVAAAGGTDLGDLGPRVVFTSERLAALPIDDSRQALGLAPGVVSRGGDLGIASVPDVTIAGSGADQTAVTVDGAPARFETLGFSQLALGAAAISELSIGTGVAPASAPDAHGAAIRYITPAGGARFAAGLTAGTDGLFSVNSTVGFNRFDGFAGGPVPRVRNVTWYVSGALYGQSSPYRGIGADTVPTFALAGLDTTVSYLDNTNTVHTVGIPRFAQVSGSCGSIGGDSGAAARAIRDNYGYRCSGLHLDQAWSTSRRAQAKLLFTYGGGSSLSLTGLASDFQQRQWPGQALADNLLDTGTRTHSAMAVLNWSQRLPTLGGGALTLTGNLSVGADGYQSGPLDVGSEEATADPGLGIEFSMLRFAGLTGLSFPLSDAVIQQLRSGAFTAPFARRYDLAAYQAFRLNPYGMSVGWPTGGFGGEVVVTSETRVNGRLGAEWRARPWLALEAGADFSRTNLSAYDGTLISGLEPDAFTAQPRRTGAFALARLASGGFTLEAGVRGEQYVTGSDFPIVPGRIFSNPATRTGDTSYASWISRVMAPGRTQRFLTPHVRVGLEADAATSAWAAFGQQVEVPPYAMLYANVNTDLAYGTSGTPFGRDVSYVTSTLIEGGLRHAFPVLTAELRAWSRNNAMPYLFQPTPVYDPFIGGDPRYPNESLNLLTGSGASHALGGSLRLTWGDAGPLAGSATYSIWRTTYEPPQQPGPVAVTYPDLTTQAASGTLVARVPDGWLTGDALGRAARGLSAALTTRVTSGQPYSPLFNSGAGALAPASGVLPNPAYQPPVYLPWTWNLDLRIAKAITVGRTRWTVYAEAHNLLDIRNVLERFAETGSDRNDLFRSHLIVPQVIQLQSDAGALWVTKQVLVNGSPQTLTGVDLSDCSLYPQGQGGSRGVVDCLALRQVEARWGNGDAFYDTGEINRALGAWYDTIYGASSFYGPARTARVGVQIGL